jgi:hypothetical protein
MNRETHYMKFFKYTNKFDVSNNPVSFFDVIFEKEIGDIVCDKIYPVVKFNYSDGTIKAYHDDNCKTYDEGDIAVFFNF